ncbi:MAG: hypothetical protein H7A43_10250 [Verrucomicrobia bacterium]|nr:hypothetical protein [Kiritimatiellia bacterium]MCB1101384.1 hypothetical protein [Kiritimatiellia bacterium]MCP5489016.1 hypothetical protein [Verrucomicrobiota bacterium]
MTCNADRHKPSNRPKKSTSERRRRVKVQRRRLVELGMDEAVVAKMTEQAIRDALRHPKKIAAQA